MVNQEYITSIILAIFASTGFWAFVSKVWDARQKRKHPSVDLDQLARQGQLQGEMLRGLAHDRICELGEMYIEKGSISKDEYENLNEYLYKPYRALGGNGTAEKIMNEIDKLPIERS